MTIRRPWKAPAIRPTLARTSSAASGLRFCGMIEEPVVKRSERWMKPNCGVIQNTISSASRDRCTAAIAPAASISSAKSRSETPSSELAIGRSKPRSRRRLVPVDRKRRAGERRRAERAFVERRARVGEPAAVARQHLDVSEQMMAEGDRLRRLQMREARHDGGRMRLGLSCQGELQRRQPLVDGIDRIAHIEPEIGGDLIVPRARRVQPPRRRPDEIGEAALDIHMNVLERARERKRAPLDLGENLIEAAYDLPRVRLRNDAAFGEHGRMRLRAANVLRRQCLVESRWRRLSPP